MNTPMVSEEKTLPKHYIPRSENDKLVNWQTKNVSPPPEIASNDSNRARSTYKAVNDARKLENGGA